MPTDQLTIAHEERLQRLEASMSQVVSTTSVTSVKVDSLVEAVKEGFTKVASRLEDGERRLVVNEGKIVILAASEAHRLKRWTTAKGAVIPLFAITAGVIFSHFGTLIWEWLVRVF